MGLAVEEAAEVGVTVTITRLEAEADEERIVDVAPSLLDDDDDVALDDKEPPEFNGGFGLNWFAFDGLSERYPDARSFFEHPPG